MNSEISGCGLGVTKGKHMSIRNKLIDLGWQAVHMNPAKMAMIHAALEVEKTQKKECQNL